MSVVDLKAQANRLGKHLAETHGVKIKHTSLQEAVAAVHGERDWNTLLSAAPKFGAAAGNSVISGAPATRHVPALSTATRPVEPLRIVGDILDCVAMQRLLVTNHIAAGGAVLCFDESGNNDMGQEMLATATAHARDGGYGVLNLARPSRSMRYSPLADGFEHEVATKLLDLIPHVNNAGAELYLGQLRVLVVNVLRAMGPEAKLARLLELLSSARKMEDFALGEGKEGLRQILESVRNRKNWTLDDERYRGLCGGLVGRLSLLLGSDAGDLLDQPNPEIRISQMRARGHITYVPLSSGTTNDFLVSCMLRDIAIHARQVAEDEGAEQELPLLVVTPVSLEAQVRAYCPEGWRVARFVSVKQSIAQPSSMKLMR